MSENMGTLVLGLCIVALGLPGMILVYLSNKKEGDKKRRMRKVAILRNDGTIEHGFAESSSLGGWEVWGEYLILSSHGEDGRFPNGCPWGWKSWAFEERSES